MKYQIWELKDFQKGNTSETIKENFVLLVNEAKPDVEPPTLQEVLDNNHDLIDGKNFQGTDAGLGNTGFNVNAFGINSALNNSGTSVNALGSSSAKNNTAFDVNAIGNSSAFNNSGNNVNALGRNSAPNNTFNNVNLFGFNTQADEDGQTVFGKDISTFVRLSTLLLTETRKYLFPNQNGTIATEDYVDDSINAIPLSTLQSVTDEDNVTTNAITTNGLVYTKAISLPSVILDSVKTAGFYKVGSLASDDPQGGQGIGEYFLTVEADVFGSAKQVLTSTGASNIGNKTYTRVTNGGAWTVWKEVLNSTDLSQYIQVNQNYIPKKGIDDTLTNSQIYEEDFGNIGIGTTTPLRKFTITGNNSYIGLHTTSLGKATIGSDSQGSFIVFDDSNFVYRLVIKSNGNIGIGTTTPTEKLDVVGNIKASGYIISDNTVEVTNSGGSNTGMSIRSTSSNLFASMDIFGGSGIDNSTKMQFGQYADGKIFFFNTGFNPIVFYTGGTERMTIGSTGNVGIGTTDTTNPFQVVNSTGNSSWKFQNGASGITPTLTITNNSGLACGLFSGTGASAFFYDGTGEFQIGTQDRATINAGTSGDIGYATNLIIYNNGTTTLPTQTLIDYNAEATGKAVVTKEVLQTQYLSFLDGGVVNADVAVTTNLVIGQASVNPKALFSVDSVTLGSSPFPRMSETERLGLPVDTGVHVYQTDGVEGVYVYKSTGWFFAY
jgi:hypothetical protein